MQKRLRRPITAFLLGFAVIYGLVLLICWRFPVYAYYERANSALVAQTLRLTDTRKVTRSLELEKKSGSWIYAYSLRINEEARTIERPYHPHAMPLFLFLALVLASPGLGRIWQLRFLIIGGGSMAVVAACMLMSDLHLWEMEVVSDPEHSRPFTWSRYVIPGLHRTAAAALLPIVIWAFLLSSFSLRQNRER